MPKTRVSAIAGGALAFSLIASAASAQTYEAVHLKTIGPNNGSPNYENIHKPLFLERLPKLSDGKITADAISQSEAGIKGPEFFRMAKLGVADIITATATYASGELPMVEGVDLSGLVQDTETLRKVVDAALPAMEEMYLERARVQPLTMWPTGGQGFWCATPLNGIDDMAGKKVRVYSSSMADMVESMGGTPVTMAFAEVVPGLQRKVIDCAVTGLNVGNLAKWADVSTHVYPLIVGWSVMSMAANKNSWERMPEANRKLIHDQAVNWAAETGWTQATEQTQHGVWCSTGDSRCDPDVAAPKKMGRYNLTLVELTPEDDKKRRELLTEIVLPRFAERCGKECTEWFNKNIGPVVGLEAHPK
ncbi:MAG: TRAP transporter substrate-binding protein [Acetobacterales bacterium]